MRMSVKNKQKMYYALLTGTEPNYKYDSDGNKIVDWVDESVTPNVTYYLDDGTEKNVYATPVQFFGNITLSGGDVNRVEYGINESNYEAVLVTQKGLLPITETSLIWFKTIPDPNNLQGSADYKVLKVSPSINVDRYILEKVVK